MEARDPPPPPYREPPAAEPAAKEDPAAAKAAPRRAAAAPKGKSPSAVKREQNKGLTGAMTEFGCLNMAWSLDPLMNVRASMGARIMMVKWRQFSQMLVIRAAHIAEKVKWRRNARWLSRSTSRELGWMWGHLGGAAQLTRGATAEPLFRGPPTTREAQP